MIWTCEAPATHTRRTHSLARRARIPCMSSSSIQLNPIQFTRLRVVLVFGSFAVLGFVDVSDHGFQGDMSLARKLPDSARCVDSRHRLIGSGHAFICSRTRLRFVLVGNHCPSRHGRARPGRARTGSTRAGPTHRCSLAAALCTLAGWAGGRRRWTVCDMPRCHRRRRPGWAVEFEWQRRMENAHSGRATPPCAAANPAIALWLPSWRPAGRVAELGSLSD